MRIALVLFSLVLLSACKQDAATQLSSPDGRLTVVLTLNDAGQPYYEIQRDGRTVVHPSALGLVLSEQRFVDGLRVQNVSRVSTVEDDYRLSHGKVREAHYRARALTVTLSNANDNTLEIEFRMSDDGLAFRYLVPDAESRHVFVKEQTEFVFDAQTRAWLQPVAVAQTGWSNTNPSYEEHYQMNIAVDQASPSPAGWVFPALYQSGDTWVAITEAGMRGDWHASRLGAESPGGVYKIAGPMEAEVKTGGALLASSEGALVSPWRIVAVGELATLFQSTLGTDLAEPARISAQSAFIQPDVSAWSWALLKDDSVNPETTREFIDYAADMGWPYVLIDVNWDQKMGYDGIQTLVDYAAAKQVGLLLWYNSAGDWNVTPYTPKGALLEREGRREEFARLQSMGIKGVKIDFFAGDGQSMLAYYIDILEDAAEFELLVNFHGATLPRGLHRTYPNLMTVEAVHGFEMITFMQSSADLAPAHMTMLPFTRNLFDPMDFTPTTFGAIPNIERLTTNGNELAQPVVFMSGIQHIAETPAGMAEAPDYVKAFMEALPVTWDESRLLSAEPGRYVALARRHGSIWYVAALNGEAQARTLALDLSFIEAESGRLIGDGETPFSFIHTALKPHSETEIELKPYGGFVATFVVEKH